jgi:hypothetical protein
MGWFVVGAESCAFEMATQTKTFLPLLSMLFAEPTAAKAQWKIAKLPVESVTMKGTEEILSP